MTFKVRSHCARVEEQTSSKHRANIELAQAGLLEPRLLAQMYRPRLRLIAPADHVLYGPSNYNPPVLLISMLITIERRASSRS